MAKRARAADRVPHLHDDLDTFLRLSATNDELMPDSLRDQLHVSTGLEDAVRAAVEAGKAVAITGTAGSGKSHLLRTAASAAPGYTCIPDLSVEPEADWNKFFNRPKKIVVAGNEGAFLVGQKNGARGFDRIIASLHAIQAGDDSRHDHDIMIIDAAGFDAAGQHVIGSLLALPILLDFMNARRGELESNAWRMMESAVVRDRVAKLVENASAHSDTEGFTFRQLWQCVSDMMVGGDTDEPWFVRLFNGVNEVSHRIARVFSPTALALPHVGNRMWHADLERLEPLFVREAVPVLRRLLAAAAREEDSEQRLVLFRSLRLLAGFGLQNSPLDSMLRAGTELWSSVTSGESRPLLQAINRYFAFGLVDFGDDLELWVQHDTERRHLKPPVQISLGSAPASDFTLVKSIAICNPPNGVTAPKGGRRLLRHLQSNAVLHVTKDLADGLVGIRSHRMHDRQDIEYDWRLTAFFEKVATAAARPDRLHVAYFDFSARTGRIMKWQITDRIQKVGG
jgi:energy-coupling factor transporter ATP-binding protein EcfA2